MKYLDTPSTTVESYDKLMAQVERGRLVAVIPVRHSKGLKGTYMFSAKPETTLTKNNSLHACVRVAVKGAHAAECEEYELVHGRQEA